MNDVKVDWSKAPKDATDLNSGNNMWYKEENGVMYYWSEHRSKWINGGSSRDGYECTFISRPKEIKSMIGKISGVDWSKAPEDATHVAKNIKGNFSHFYKKVGVEWNFAKDKNDGYLTSVNAEYEWFAPISKEDDLQLVTKPKYSSLQELPVGTFVKLNHGEDNTCVWTGRVLAQMNPSQGVVDCWDEAQVNNYEGFRYKFNSDFDIVAYSDKYDGEYISVVEEQPAQVTPQAIKDGWKIKHIKHPEYKCGRDVAVTILYRDVLLRGVGCTEYKYSICSPKDMFDRKVGVQTAMSKESRTIMSRDGLFRKILCDILASKQSVSTQFEELVKWYCNNH